MEVNYMKIYEIKSKKTMSVKEFCKEYGIGQNKAYELVNIKGFPMIRCGVKIIILRSKVDEWMINQIGKSFSTKLPKYKLRNLRNA